MLSKHCDHPTVYPIILKLPITTSSGNITLIPKEATQEKTRKFEMQPEKVKKNEKKNKIKKEND